MNTTSRIVRALKTGSSVLFVFYNVFVIAFQKKLWVGEGYVWWRTVGNAPHC